MRSEVCTLTEPRPSLHAREWCLVVPSAQMSDMEMLLAWPEPTYIIVGAHRRMGCDMGNWPMIGYVELHEDVTLSELCTRFPRVQWEAARVPAVAAAPALTRAAGSHPHLPSR